MACGNEAMRLFTPAWVADREALTDDQYGEYSYPAGTVVITYFYGLHRSPTGQTPAMKPLLTLRPDKVILDLHNTGALI